MSTNSPAGEAPPPVTGPVPQTGRRIPRRRRLLAAAGTALVAVTATFGGLVATAPPAHALDTVFSTANMSGEGLILKATPKGTFTRVVSTTFLNFRKIPWAVYGRKYALFSSSRMGPG